MQLHGYDSTKPKSLLNYPPIYKPIRYDWAHEAWKIQQQLHWLPEEVPLADDVKDWKNKLTEPERNLLTQIFRFFTQADVEVQNNYMTKYSNIFKPTEVLMMLSAFANMETIHIEAYSELLDTIGMPETEYMAFLEYQEMADKYEYLQNFDTDSLGGIARNLAVFGAFTEGVALFASFVILLNFTRHNKMRGMGQIVSWSVRDESLHCENIIKLFRTFIMENPEIWDDELKTDIYNIATRTVELEDCFIDLTFEQGGIQGLEANEVKQYIRYISDRRLIELGMKPIFNVKDNPLPWVDHLISGVEHTNFFENRATAYSKSATSGKWEDAYQAVLDSEK
jgi:ribonucleoside-diphosphate reductase beta chain